MRIFTSAVCVLVALGLIGCKKSPTPEAAYLPPPDPGGDTMAIDDSHADVGPTIVTASDLLADADVGHGGSYTIRRGDTLWSIATRVYGNGQRWQDIASANNIADPKRLPVGRTLVLP